MPMSWWPQHYLQCRQLPMPSVISDWSHWDCRPVIRSMSVEDRFPIRRARRLVFFCTGGHEVECGADQPLPGMAVGGSLPGSRILGVPSRYGPSLCRSVVGVVQVSGEISGWRSRPIRLRELSPPDQCAGRKVERRADAWRRHAKNPASRHAHFPSQLWPQHARNHRILDRVGQGCERPIADPSASPDG